MTTYILTKYNVITNVEGGHKHLSAKTFYDGIEMELLIHFKSKQHEIQFTEQPIIAFKGRFKENLNPFSITLLEAEQTELPRADNWVAFLTNYFIESGATSIGISEYREGLSISPKFEHYYIWSEISKGGELLKKLEFGRLLPLEQPEYKRKSTSWTKGVLLNDPNSLIEFMQTSWDGEEGTKYHVTFNDNNIELVTKFLSVPFQYGWTEYDYRIGKKMFYKACAKTSIDNYTYKNCFTLLDEGEQDIPFGFIDKIDQWIRTKWGDSYINNRRRNIDKKRIEPIKKTANRVYDAIAGK